MPRQSELIAKRNKNVRERFTYHRKKNPKWTIYAVIEAVSGEFFLAEVTIVKILKSGDMKVPAPSTIKRNTAIV